MNSRPEMTAEQALAFALGEAEGKMRVFDQIGQGVPNPTTTFRPASPHAVKEVLRVLSELGYALVPKSDVVERL